MPYHREIVSELIIVNMNVMMWIIVNMNVMMWIIVNMNVMMKLLTYKRSVGDLYNRINKGLTTVERV